MAQLTQHLESMAKRQLQFRQAIMTPDHLLSNLMEKSWLPDIHTHYPHRSVLSMLSGMTVTERWMPHSDQLARPGLHLIPLMMKVPFYYFSRIKNSLLSEPKGII